jgi:MFS transporter, MHS family, alpha-ketoglutarate permease
MSQMKSTAVSLDETLTASLAPDARSKASMPVRSVVAGTIGNAFEWFDWSVYTTFAVFFGHKFFPSGNTTSALLSTFAVFAVGFAMRPLGGWAIGTLSDRLGRRTALTLSIVMMAGSSLAIAMLPTYETIGIAAPALLVMFRLVQGLAVGGEYAAATTFVGETSPANRRGFYGSWVFFTTALGLLMASALAWLLTHLLSHDAMTEYGWRIPFFIGGVGAIVGFWIRRSVAETPAFLEMERRREQAPKRSLAWLLREHRVETRRLIGFSVLGAFAFYLFTGYLPVYAIQHAGATPSTAYAATTLGLLIYMLSQPLFGMLSDRIGRRPQLIVYALGYALFVYPVVLATGASVTSILLVDLFGLLLYGMYSAIAPAVMVEMFSTEVRGVGIGTVYNTVVALLGGTTPYLMAWLQSHNRENWFLLYVSAGAVISLITYWLMPETKGRALT